jgi:hypothetical protein
MQGLTPLRLTIDKRHGGALLCFDKAERYLAHGRLRQMQESSPQRLKPSSAWAVYGTAEAVPFVQSISLSKIGNEQLSPKRGSGLPAPIRRFWKSWIAVHSMIVIDDFGIEAISQIRISSLTLREASLMSTSPICSTIIEWPPPSEGRVATEQ